MKTWKKHLAILFAASMIITALPINAQAASKSKIKLSKSKLTLNVGNTKTLKLKGTKKNPKWSSSKKSVATVTKKGKVKAKKKGSTVITAKLGKKKYKCKVTVKSKTTTPAAVPNTVPTTVSTEKPAVVPGNTPTKDPTVTPTTPPVLPNNYQTLADYITTNGTFDSEEEAYSIEKSEQIEEAILDTTISYNASKSSFEFVAMLVAENGVGNILSLEITPQDYTKGDMLYILFESIDNYLYAGGEVTLSSVTATNTGITYIETNAAAEIKDDMYDLADDMFNLGLQSWSSMLEENNVGVTLKDLGFTSYEG